MKFVVFPRTIILLVDSRIYPTKAFNNSKIPKAIVQFPGENWNFNNSFRRLHNINVLLFKSNGDFIRNYLVSLIAVIG